MSPALDLVHDGGVEGAVMADRDGSGAGEDVRQRMVNWVNQHELVVPGSATAI